MTEQIWRNKKWLLEKQIYEDKNEPVKCLARTGACASVWNQLHNGSCMDQRNRNILGQHKVEIWS